MLIFGPSIPASKGRIVLCLSDREDASLCKKYDISIKFEQWSSPSSINDKKQKQLTVQWLAERKQENPKKEKKK